MFISHIMVEYGSGHKKLKFISSVQQKIISVANKHKYY
jgi:hypothetical protein